MAITFESASYIITALVAYTLGMIMLSRNFYNPPTRWLASAMFVLAINFSVLAYRFATSTVFARELVGIGLTLNVLAFPLFYITLRSFQRVHWYDYLTFILPIAVALYVISAPPFGSLNVSTSTLLYIIILPISIALALIVTATVIVGYRIWRRIEIATIKSRFGILLFGIALYGYARLASVVLVYYANISITGFPMLLGLLIIAYSVIYNPSRNTEARRTRARPTAT